MSQGMINPAFLLALLALLALTPVTWAGEEAEAGFLVSGGRYGRMRIGGISARPARVRFGNSCAPDPNTDAVVSGASAICRVRVPGLSAALTVQVAVLAEELP